MKAFERRIAALEKQRAEVAAGNDVLTILRTVIVGDNDSGWFDVDPTAVEEVDGPVWRRDPDESREAFLGRIQVDIDNDSTKKLAHALRITDGKPGTPIDCPANEAITKQGRVLIPPRVLPTLRQCGDTHVGRRPRRPLDHINRRSK